MEEQSATSKLRQRAAWCRVLAQGPCSERLAQELEAIARAYEIDAETIARGMADQTGVAANAPIQTVRALPINTYADASKIKSSQLREGAVVID